jgi:hypothetical protein
VYSQGRGAYRQFFYNDDDEMTNDELWENAQPPRTGPICRYCHAKLGKATDDMECDECKDVANAVTVKKEDYFE